MVRLGYTHLQVIPTHKYLAHHKLLQSLQVVVSMCIQPGCWQVKQSVWMEQGWTSLFCQTTTTQRSSSSWTLGCFRPHTACFTLGHLCPVRDIGRTGSTLRYGCHNHLLYIHLCVCFVSVFLNWLELDLAISQKIYQIQNLWCEFSLEMFRYHFSFQVQISIPELMYHTIKSTDPITVYIIIY